MKRGQERLLVAGDPNSLEMPVPWDNHQEQQQQWSGAGLSFEDQLCVLQRAEPEKPLGGAQKITSGSQMLDTELFILLEFGFALFTL